MTAAGIGCAIAVLLAAAGFVVMVGVLTKPQGPRVALHMTEVVVACPFGSRAECGCGWSSALYPWPDQSDAAGLRHEAKRNRISRDLAAGPLIDPESRKQT